MVWPCSFIPRMTSSHLPLFRKLSQERISSLVTLASIRSLFSPCLCQSSLPARQYSYPVFYLRNMVGFLNSKFNGPGRARTCTDPKCLVPVCPRKAVILSNTGLHFMVKYFKTPATMFAALCRCFCCYANEGQHVGHPPSLLSLKRPCHLSQKHSKKGSDPGDPQTALSAPRSLLSSPQDHH